jgi:hypothetical protein
MPKLTVAGHEIVNPAGVIDARLCGWLNRKLAMASPLLCVLLVVAASPASAQSNRDNPFGGGSRLGPKEAQIVQSGPDAARTVMQALGQCVYARRPEKAERYLAIPTDTREYDILGRQMIDSLGDRCLGGDGELQFSNGLFRGALFEAAYRKKFTTKPAGSFEGTADIGWFANYEKPLSDAGKRHIIVQDLAECVVRGNPSLARALIFSGTGSANEDRLVKELSKLLGPCLVSGQKAEVSKPSLRAFLAEALYRLSVAREASAARKEQQ